jgi:hypothetical protein
VRTLRSFAVLVLLVLLVDGLVTAAHAGSASVRLSAIATGYAPGCGDSGTTATGRRPGWGTVSVDPRVIPLYSRLYVSGYGHGRALDTGSAIQGCTARSLVLLLQRRAPLGTTARARHGLPLMTDTPVAWSGWDTIEQRLETRAWRRRYDQRDQRTAEEIAADEAEVVEEISPSLAAEALVLEMQRNPYGRTLPTFDEAA